MRSFLVFSLLSFGLCCCPSQKAKAVGSSTCCYPGTVPSTDDTDCLLPSGEIGVMICRNTDAGLTAVCQQKRTDPQY